MQLLKSTLTVGLLAAIVAACGNAGATQGPGGATTNPGGGGGGGATAAPQATVNPGGGGGGGNKPPGWDQYGKVSFELNGPPDSDGELGYIPLASAFNGAGGTTLYFGIEDGEEVFVISIITDTFTASYGTSGLTASGTTCTTSNLNVQGTSASGSFDCSSVVVISEAGIVSAGSLKGTFDAHN